MTKNRFVRAAKRLIVKGLGWGEKLPLIVRFPLGIAFCIGGVLGFLPVLGFWMLPLGILLIGMCIPGIDRRIKRWMERVEVELATPLIGSTRADQNRPK